MLGQCIITTANSYMYVQQQVWALLDMVLKWVRQIPIISHTFWCAHRRSSVMGHFHFHIFLTWLRSPLCLSFTVSLFSTVSLFLSSQGCRLRKLPPVLTFALLRFLYDYSKLERYKVNWNGAWVISRWLITRWNHSDTVFLGLVWRTPPSSTSPWN